MEKVFSYGTLQDPAILKALIGREVQGYSDELPGFKLGSIRLNDGEFLIVEPDHQAPNITGTVLAVTKAELIKFDVYETDAYQRRLETLASGTQAWVYQK